jgi:hypothetical protein
MDFVANAVLIDIYFELFILKLERADSSYIGDCRMKSNYFFCFLGI